MSDFTEAPRLSDFDKQSVAKYNFDKLTKLATPIARISAVHSGRNVKSALSDNAGGLDTEMCLARGAANANVQTLAGSWAVQWCHWCC